MYCFKICLQFLTAQLPDDAVTGAFAAQAKAVFPRAAAFSPLHTVATIRAEADVAASKVATYSDEVAGAADKVATLAISDGAKD